MRFGCRCGHTIVDNTDDLPYKASTIPAQSLNAFYDAIDVIWKGKMPTNVFEQDRLMDPISHPKGSRLIYQCPKCGRVFIASHGSRMYSFKPEEEDIPKNLLSSES